MLNFIHLLNKFILINKANPESLHIARQMIFLIFELASKEILKDEEALKAEFFIVFSPKTLLEFKESKRVFIK